MILVGLTPDQIGHAVTEAQRPNGSVNVNLLVRYADWLVRQAARDGRPPDDDERTRLNETASVKNAHECDADHDRRV